MITVRCLGHIATSVGSRDVELQDEELAASEVVERLRMTSVEKDPGFTKYNTLVLIEDGEAFVAAGSARKVRGGQRVVLIPFSHGG